MLQQHHDRVEQQRHKGSDEEQQQNITQAVRHLAKQVDAHDHTDRDENRR